MLKRPRSKSSATPLCRRAEHGEREKGKAERAPKDALRQSKEDRPPKNRLQLFAPFIILITAYAVVLAIQLYLYHNNIHDDLWLRYFKYLSGQRLRSIIYGAAAFAAMFSIVLLSKRLSFKPVRLAPGRHRVRFRYQPSLF